MAGTLRFRDRVLRLPRKFVGAPRLRPTTREVFGTLQIPVMQQDRLETEYFERVVLPNGTIKTTRPHRLDDLNQAALPLIASMGERPVKIMDVGISSGVSTIEWHEQLAAEGIPCDVIGTDLTVYASLMSLTRHLGALVDRDRNFLHLDAFGHGAPPTASGVRGIFAGVIRGIFRAAMKIDKHLPPLQGHVGESAKGRLLTCEPVTLLTRKFAQRDSVRVTEEDLLAPEKAEYEQAFHVIRAANVLNRAYFPDATLTRIASKLKQRLKPHGLLIVCRTTPDRANHASIFELMEDSRLRVVHRLGGGAEVEDLLAGV